MGLLPVIRAIPVSLNPFHVLAEDSEPPMSPHKPTLWIYLAVAIALVLLGGAFAGLTIALMGQDEINLQVIKTSGEGSERSHAARVLRLLKRGKHWVLVTLLLGNVITNETLPIVLDRSLGGGWPAVLGSTVLIVIFGEVIPQSICVRYGLPIGAWMSPLVLILMYILAPVAWPTAKLLDRLLGEDHGTTYKKAGLKTLVTLHKSLGEAGEQLNEDEVTIISAVLDLKAKAVGDIMTPMDNVFTLSADTVLDQKTMEYIEGAGFSRIPVHSPENNQNFVGMLLVKILITYDPEDCKRVRDFALATLPETRAETSCLDIVNFFQEGKSHMVLVSEYPGDDHGALGVVTLEDVIEELIGEEIIDESDVYIDVQKAIRRTNVAPKYRVPNRVPKGKVVTDPDDTIADVEEDLIDVGEDNKEPQQTMRRHPISDGHIARVNGVLSDLGSPPRVQNALRRSSSTAVGSDREGPERRGSKGDGHDKFKNLGPSNLASRPRQTRYNTVKIKPGGGLADGTSMRSQDTPTSDTPRAQSITAQGGTAAQGGIGAGLVGAGKDAKDGVLALQAGYGTINSGSPPSPKNSRRGNLAALAENGTDGSRQPSPEDYRSGLKESSRTGSQDTVGSMQSGVFSPKTKRRPARSGSITENIIDAGGFKKTVLEMTSSSDDNENGGATIHSEGSYDGHNSEGKENHKSGGGGKKKRRRRKRKGGEGGGNAERDALLGNGRD